MQGTIHKKRFSGQVHEVNGLRHGFGLGPRMDRPLQYKVTISFMVDVHNIAIYLTPDEAEEHANNVLRQVALARAEQKKLDERAL